MDAWYKGKLLARLGAAWPLSKLRPIDVEEVDTRTWSVRYQHVETGDVTTALLKKRDVRRQERLHRLPAFGVDAGQTPALDPVRPADQTDEPAPAPVVAAQAQPEVKPAPATPIEKKREEIGGTQATARRTQAQSSPVSCLTRCS